MKQIRLIAALLVLLTAAFTTMARAQRTDDIEERKANLPAFVDDSKRIEFNLYYVLQSVKTNLHHIPGGEESLNTADLSRNQIEATIGYYFGRYKTFGVEIVGGLTQAGGQTQEFGQFDDPDNPVIFPVKDLEHTVYNIGGNLIYNMGNLEFVPFIYVGGGMEFFDVGEESDYPLTESYPYLNLGIGFKYMHAEWIGGAIRLEDRYHFYDDEVSQGALNQYRLTIGATLAF